MSKKSNVPGWKYWVAAAIIFIYLLTGNDIINTAWTFNIILGAVILASYSFYYIRCEKRKKQKPKRTKKYGRLVKKEEGMDWADYAIHILTVVIVSFIIFLAVSIPVNLFIVSYADSQPCTTEVFDIKGYTTGRKGNRPKVRYIFADGKSYWVGYKKQESVSEKELIEDYQLSICYSKSVLGTYVGKTYSVQRK